MLRSAPLSRLNVSRICLLVLGFSCGAFCLRATAATAWAGRHLTDILTELKASGMALIYSNQVVTGDMRIAAEPQSEDPLARLVQALTPFGLTVRTIQGRVYVISPAPPAPPAKKPAAAMPLPPAPLEEVVVSTSRYRNARDTLEAKTGASLVETPASISVVSSDQMRDRNVQTLTEALAYTVGVAAQKGGPNLTDDLFVIRGFESGPVFVDGTLRNLNTLDPSPSVEPYSLERLELLKGPASVLFGQTSPGGVVNVETKRPSERSLHELEMQGGNFNRRQLSADFTGPLDEQAQWLYRITALGRDGATSIDFTRNYRRYLAPALTWKPTDDTAITLLTSYQKNRTSYYYGLPGEGTVSYNPNGVIPTNRNLGEPDDYFNSEATSVGYLLEHRVNGVWQVRQNLRYSRREMDYRMTWASGFQADLRMIDRGLEARRNHDNALTLDNLAQAHWTSGRVEHRALIGLDYRHMNYDERRYDGAASPLDLFNPVYRMPPGPLSPTYGEDDRAKQIGFYAQDQLKLDKKWVWLLGARYDVAQFETTDWLSAATTSQTERDFTFRTGIVYLAESGLAPYASFSESFQPTIGLNAERIPYRPTTGRQYEIGIKYQPPHGAMLFTVSLYDLRQRNVQTPDPRNADNVLQTGKVTSRGVEVEANAQLGQHLNLTGTYSYTSSVVTESSIIAEMGTRLGGVPRQKATLWADYERDRIRLGLGVRYMGESLGLLDTSLRRPTFAVADALLGYTVDRLHFSININNLLDNRYVESCTYGCFYGERRMLVGSVAYRW